MLQEARGLHVRQVHGVVHPVGLVVQTDNNAICNTTLRLDFVECGKLLTIVFLTL